VRRALLDTSVLIGNQEVPDEFETMISVVSVAELHFGFLLIADEEKRAARLSRLGKLEARFPYPLPIDDRVARIWGKLKAVVSQRGANPRKRTADLGIAATAIVHEAVLITANPKDLKLVKDLVEIRAV